MSRMSALHPCPFLGTGARRGSGSSWLFESQEVLGAYRCVVGAVGICAFGSALTWVSPPEFWEGFLPWQLGVVTIRCLPLCQTLADTICIVLFVILTVSL